MTHAEISDLFQRLDACLWQYKALWQLVPFAEQQVPWQQQYPELYQTLMTMPEQEVKALSQADDVSGSPCLAWLPELAALFRSPLLQKVSSNQQPDPVAPFWLAQGIKGRKLTQITRFVSALPVHSEQTELLEWCAGKGHLGRLAAYVKKQKCTSLEWQLNLCQAGEQAAAQHSIAQSFVHLDVLQQNAQPYIHSQSGVMALHACGQLHQTCITQAVKAKAAWLTISPCCYHLVPDKHYQAMSKLGKASVLSLSKLDLKLPLQQLVTGGNRQRQLREKELCWRLAFSHYCQLLRVSQEYVSLPNFPKALLAGEYRDFVLWAIEAKKQSRQPLQVPFSPAVLPQSIQLAQAQLPVLERIELIRSLFRRPLELWLLLDKALFLIENGYQIAVEQFCDFKVTPRNYLLRAVRSH